MKLPRLDHDGAKSGVLLASFAALIACAGPPRPPATREPEPATTEREPIAEPTEPSPETEPEPEPAEVRVTDSLADGALRTPREGVHLNLGTPGGGSATLGGFGTGLRRSLVDERPVGLVNGTVARMPIDPIANAEGAAEAWELRLALRTFTNTPVTAYWNDEVLGHFDASTTFGEHRIAIDRARAVAGGLLMLRARRRGRHEGASASLAIDTITLAPEGTGPADGWGWQQERLIGAGERLEIAAGYDALVLADGLDPAQLSGPATLELAAYEGRVARVQLFAAEGADEERNASEEAGAADELDPHAMRISRVPAERYEPRAPRNVLMILIDTLRADKLRPYAPESRVTTPALMRFVEGATVFERGHSQENWTKPSVATLLTGLMPWQHRATQHASTLPRSLDLLPERLKNAGFTTASFICNGFVSDRFGFDQGWDRYRNYIREGRRTRSEFVAADVLEWLDERDEEKPFFLYVHTIDPHVPYRPPRDVLAAYGDPDYRGPVNFSRDATLLEHIKLGQLRLNARDRDHLEALYDGEISYHDQHFGAILDGLEARGLDDETLVVITSDHGEEFWDHGSVGHGHSVYEELLHVPFFVRMPGQRS
ncbi:MAG: sulfatase [Myxococcota bacterium]